MGNHINVPPVGAHVDDSYMYQLSLVVATATVSFVFILEYSSAPELLEPVL